jgi:hypothetical protein
MIDNSISLLEELTIWYEAEKASKKLLENDSLLLELVTLKLADLRVSLIESEDNREEYTLLYKALTNLLSYRLEKYTGGVTRDTK